MVLSKAARHNKRRTRQSFIFDEKIDGPIDSDGNKRMRRSTFKPKTEDNDDLLGQANLQQPIFIQIASKGDTEIFRST